MSTVEAAPLEDTVRLREYLSVLWKRKWSVVAFILVGLLGAYFFTQKETRQFTSTISVVVTNPLAQISQGGAPNMVSERSLVFSQPVAQCVTLILKNPSLNHLGANLDQLCSAKSLSTVVITPGLKQNLTVIVPTGSSVLTISKVSPHKKESEDVAQAFALSYVQYKVSTAMAQLDAQRAPLLVRQASLDKASAATQASINQLLAAVPPNAPAINAAVQKRSAIDSERTQISQELFGLSPTKLTDPTIVAPASIPQKPSSPNKLLNLAVGLFVGLALGFGQAFLREHLDDRLRTELDLAGSAQAPVLAVIPGASLLGTLRRKKGELATRERPAGAQAEAFRTLRTGLIVAKMQEGVTTLLLTSPNQDVSRTAANLAVVLADADKRVILVSANLRNPRIHTYFGLDNDAGLSSVLSGEANLLDVFKKQETQNLRILRSGPVPANPGEMLQSDKMRALLAELCSVADFIILDSSPVLSVADATTLSTLVDGVILVGDAQRTTRSEAARASRQLNQVAAPLLGAVLVNYDPRKARARASARTYYGYPDQHRYRVAAGPVFSTNGQVAAGEEHAITGSEHESAP